MPSTLVFIHGMYLNGRSWDPWVKVATARGYSCQAPSWPMHDGEPEERRRTVDPRLGRLTFGAVATYLKGLIDQLPERPVLIGHSVGGLLAQRLVADGYASAAVSISPAPPPGVLSGDPHFWRANFPHINPFAGNRPIQMTKPRFHYTFCNTMSRADSDEAFDRYVVPESRNVPRTTLTPQARIRFRAPHAPMLLIGGAEDHLTPLAMVRRNARAYSSNVDFLEFAGRPHFLCNAPGWEEIAEASLGWLAQH